MSEKCKYFVYSKKTWLVALGSAIREVSVGLAGRDYVLIFIRRNGHAAAMKRDKVIRNESTVNAPR